MIIDVVLNIELSLIIISTYNGNIYYTNLDGIRHQKQYKNKQSDLIEYKLLTHLKYVNISEILMKTFNNINYLFLFGELSSHKLTIIEYNNKLNAKTNIDTYIPQYNGIMHSIKSFVNYNKSGIFSDSNIYISYGYNAGGRNDIDAYFIFIIN